MTKFKKIFALAAIVFTISAGSLTVYAASNYNTPAEALSGLTGRTYESVTAERSNTGSTYGKVASEAGVLTEFKIELLEMKKDQLAAKVADGSLTQSEADSLLVTLQEQQANCSGEGSGMQAALGMNSMFGNQQQIGTGTGLMNGTRLQDGTEAGNKNGSVQAGTGVHTALGMGTMSGNQQQIGTGSGLMNNTRLQDGTGTGSRNNSTQTGLRNQTCLVTE